MWGTAAHLTSGRACSRPSPGRAFLAHDGAADAHGRVPRGAGLQARGRGMPGKGGRAAEHHGWFGGFQAKSAAEGQGHAGTHIAGVVLARLACPGRRNRVAGVAGGAGRAGCRARRRGRPLGARAAGCDSANAVQKSARCAGLQGSVARRGMSARAWWVAAALRRGTRLPSRQQHCPASRLAGCCARAAD